MPKLCVHRYRFGFLGCLVGLSLWAGGGCTRTPRESPPKSPMEVSVEVAQRRSYKELERAWKEAHSLPNYTLLVRYNPSRSFSTCPDFEVHYGGRWRRVILNASDDLLEILARFREQHPAPTPPSLLFVGSPTGSAERCPDTQQWVEVFALDDVLPLTGSEFDQSP